MSVTPDKSLNLDAWIPDEKDKPRILKELWDYCKGTLECCGPGEESREANQLYQKVAQNRLEDCKDDVQAHFVDLYWAVEGELERYYGNEPEVISLINLTVRPESN